MTLFALCAYGAACAALCRLCPRRLRWIVLLLLSLGFYAVRGLRGLPFLLLTGLSTWLGALLMERAASAPAGAPGVPPPSREEKHRRRAQVKRRQRAMLAAVLTVNFGLLFALKMADELLGWFGAQPLGWVLPLGISFYTFQSMGYLIDVYGGKTRAERNPARFLLFVSFFPQLIQGPIGRYGQLAPQLASPPDVDAQGAKRGALLMLWGLFKKMVIADRALPLVSGVFDAPGGEFGGAMTVLAVLAYSLQQYTDFSGGIDLVTGIAELCGVQLAPNFRRPYFAVSLGDFWRRWHISLGAWMRDYVFYPFALTRPMRALSRTAKGRFGAEIARALPAALGNILVFLLVGLWHGATASFVLWGLYNGVILAVSALLEPAYRRFGERHAALADSRGFHVLRVLRTFVIVNIGWFFDRCASASGALRMMGAVLCSPQAGQLTGQMLAALGLPAADAWVLSLSAALLFAVSLAQERGRDVRGWVLSRPLPLRWAIIIGAVVAVLLLGVWGSGFDEATFIYYQL